MPGVEQFARAAGDDSHPGVAAPADVHRVSLHDRVGLDMNLVRRRTATASS